MLGIYDRTIFVLTKFLSFFTPSGRSHFFDQNNVHKVKVEPFFFRKFFSAQWTLTKINPGSRKFPDERNSTTTRWRGLTKSGLNQEWQKHGNGKRKNKATQFILNDQFNRNSTKFKLKSTNFNPLPYNFLFNFKE